MSEPSPVRVRRWPRPVLTLVALLVVVCVGAAGVWVGYALRSSTAQQIAAASRPVLVTAKAKEIQQSLSAVTGTVDAVTSDPYVPVSSAFSGPMVVTDDPLTVGASVKAGQFVGSIDDAPVFGLPLSIPLWRDLSVGDTGSDVQSLNAALAGAGYFHGTVNDDYSWLTAAGLEAMFKTAGYPAPSVSGATTSSAAAVAPGDFLPMSSIADIPSGSLVVSQAVATGGTLAAGKPMWTLVGAVSSVSSKLDILHEQKVKAGTVVNLQKVDGPSLGTGTITTIGSFQAGNPQGSGMAALSGYPITVSLNPPKGVSVQSGDQVQISFTPAGAAQLAVPTVAIRQTTGAPYVIVKQTHDRYRRVHVSPAWQQGGWTGIDSGSQLKTGSTVVVSGR